MSYCRKCRMHHPPGWICKRHRYVLTNSQRSKILQKYMQDPQLFPTLAKEIIRDLFDWIIQLEQEIDPKVLAELKDWSNVHYRNKSDRGALQRVS